MTNEITKFMITKIAAMIVQSVLIQAAIGESTVNGNFATIIGIKLSFKKIYETVVITNGATMNGIARIGFMTIGAPKIMGSLILKSPGSIDSFPNCFKYLDFENIKRTTRANVAPDPPIQTNH